MKFNILRNFKKYFLLGISLGLPCTSAFGESSEWIEGKSKASRVRLISQIQSLSPDSFEILLGLEFRLDPGWHVYWKNAGDVGYPPKLNWKLPPTWEAGPLHYPSPIEFPSPGQLKLSSYGYKDQVIYPVYLQGKKTDGLKFPVELYVEYLVCKEQCIPEKAQLELSLPINTEKPSTHSKTLEAALQQLPVETQNFKVNWESEKTLRIEFEDFSPHLLVFHSEGLKGKFWEIEKESPTQFRISFNKSLGQSLEFVGVGEEKSVQSQIPLKADSNNESFLWMLALAFLGGLILNLMPCVLPVVVMKTSFLLQLRERGASFRSSLILTMIGIISSFLVLGLITAGLRALGQQVGWGFQFQNPGFLIFLIFLLFIFALNLFDLFEFKLPLSWSNKMASQSGAFFEGVFTTLLATPCTAPFLGSALSFALSQNISVSLLAFLAMSLGLSFPYLAIFVCPSFLRFLPRPGSWMAVLKRFLAYSIIFIILWLSYLSLRLTSLLFFIGLLASLVFTYILIREIRTAWKWLGVGLIFFFMVFSSLKSFQDFESPHSQTYSIQEFKNEIRSEKPIFLYITADWCITCKFNEATVIQTDWFRNFAKENSFEIRRLDWTERNEEVAQFLDQFGKVGIPFSIIVKKNEYQLLPELMTKSNTAKIIQDALNSSARNKNLPF